MPSFVAPRRRRRGSSSRCCGLVVVVVVVMAVFLISTWSSQLSTTTTTTTAVVEASSSSRSVLNMPVSSSSSSSSSRSASSIFGVVRSNHQDHKRKNNQTQQPADNEKVEMEHPHPQNEQQDDEEQEDDDDKEEEVIYVRKSDGSRERLDGTKILQRLQRLAADLMVEEVSPPLEEEEEENDQALTKTKEQSPLQEQEPQPHQQLLDLEGLTSSILRGLYPDVTTHEIDTLAAETAASRATQHVLYGRLAARILVSQNHQLTPSTFSHALQTLQKETKYVHPTLVELVQRRHEEIDDRIRHDRDNDLSYFGLKTLERSYLLKSDAGIVLERPQYLMMRVALGIHCTTTNTNTKDEAAKKRTTQQIDQEEEDARLAAAFETYELMSRGYFTHASPTLFHSGTTHPQLSSCFLVQMSDDSIAGIYDTLKRCAVISKSAGGIGLSVHNIRARGTPIRGTRGTSNGLIPMLRVYDVTSRYVDQGGGKRPGAFAVYLEPWHGDILDVLNLKKNHGKEEQRARDLFYGLWIPDLFMERVERDEMWSLMCPHQCPGLSECHGQAFEDLYQQYEQEGRFLRQMRARDVWSAILESQIETGTPYMLYKDAANEKSNQKNLGTIQCSNLCTEIIQYTDEEEVAVCNLASLCLPKFVVSNRGPYGSTNAESGHAYFDHEALHRTTKIVTKNLNRIIDINSYPVPGALTSNQRHRPIGIGVSGLADAFIRLGLPFTSDTAKELNEAIFETIYHAAIEASIELAEKEGAYETFDGSPASQGILQFDLWGAQAADLPSQRRGSKTRTSKLEKYESKYQDGGYDWESLRGRMMKHGLRNSLLVAPMPTASTSQILGVNECFEPFSSNLYLRRVKAGEFIMANPHLLQDLMDRGLWTSEIRNQLMRDGGSVANIDAIPDRLKEIYKTVWEIKMKNIIDMAADRGKFIDQSQSLNLFIADPTMDKLTAMHFYAWKKGLKTGMYYLRTKPAVNAIQYTVDKGSSSIPSALTNPTDTAEAFDDDSDVCLSCQA